MARCTKLVSRCAIVLAVNSCVIPNSIEQTGFCRGEPGQADEIETAISAHSCGLDREAVGIQDRQFHEREIEGIACRPYDFGYSTSAEVKHRHERGLEAVSQRTCDDEDGARQRCDGSGECLAGTPS